MSSSVADQHLPSTRQKDIKTAIKYLAASYNTIPQALTWTTDLEAMYREHLRTYLEHQHKGVYTIRNVLQTIGQFWKVMHTYQLTPTVPGAVPARAIVRPHAARKAMDAASPYAYMGWLTTHPYCQPIEQWPAEITQRWRAYRQSIRHQVRAITLNAAYSREFSGYVSYHLTTPDDRLAQLPPPAHARIRLRQHADDLEEILFHPVVTTWEDLLRIGRVHSFITWQSWRVFPWGCCELPEGQSPPRPTQHAMSTVKLLNRIAHTTGHPSEADLHTVSQGLVVSHRIHDKQAPVHRFDLAELEQVAQAIMAEARIMPLSPQARAKGSRRAIRFQIGLMLALAWRNPMRARNWCEARLGIHLRQVDGVWYWHFQGEEMKIGARGGQPNIFEPVIDDDIVAALEEYLTQYRPLIPNAATDDHVFLTERGGRLSKAALLWRLRVHTYRFTSKRLYTHLLRSLFSSHHLSHGVDINSVAYALNDTPKTVLTAYNQLHAEKHRPIIQEANRRALTNGHGQVFTPPVIPLTPKPPRVAPVNPDQLSLL